MDVITHPYPYFNVSLTKPPSRLGMDEWLHHIDPNEVYLISAGKRGPISVWLHLTEADWRIFAPVK